MPEPWSQIEQHFHELADLPPETQRRLLAERFADRPELHRRLEALLARDRNADPFLERPVVSVTTRQDGNGEPPAASTGLAGTTVGGYRLVEPIAYGGMGTVYVARPAGGGGPPVAVKLLREVIDADRVVKRFRAERRALAHLDHPNIVRLLDAGTTDHGAPYLVMEYVDGVPIDAYCNGRRLSLRPRLDLFCEVCQAVHAAHRSLVVHRDLKPDNILVTGDGVPKLVDFGIARLLESETDARDRTATLSRLLTPEYASPEQVRGEPVTTATDVYSLGVVLYGLLAGCRPYRFEAGGPGEVERLVCLRMPPRPSTAAVSPGLRRRLRGDLDNIVMTALRKEPERRYESAAAFAEDIRRHLSGHPVAARPDTVWYRTRKLLLRNKVSTGIAAVLALLLLAGTIAIAWQARVASGQRDAAQIARLEERRQRERAEAAEREARNEAESARRVSEFLVDVFEVADPNEVGGDTITARQVLEEASTRLRRERDLPPEVRATLADAVGRVSLNLGLYDTADRLLNEALELRRSALGDDGGPTLETLASVGRLRYARGEYEQARDVFERLVELHGGGAGTPTVGLAEALNDLGAASKALGDLEGAEPLYRRALEMRRALLGDDDPAVAESLNNLAGLHMTRGELDEARRELDEALRVRRAALGDDHPLTAQTISNLAFVAYVGGDLEAAESAYREALVSFEEVYGEDHPALATVAAGLGTVLQARGELGEAETHLRRALELRRRRLGDEHPAIAVTLTRLSRVLQADGRLREARDALEEAVHIRRATLPPNRTETAGTLQAYGALLLELDELEAAEAAWREALSLYREALPAGHLFIAVTEQSLARALVARGRDAEAAPLLRSALAAFRTGRGEEDPGTRRIAAELEALEARLGPPED